MRVLSYLKGRIEERSTWVGIGAAIVGGSTLPSPFCWLAIGAGVMAALAPSKKDAS